MRCPNCGREVEPGTKFCTNCGAAVQEAKQNIEPRKVAVRQKRGGMSPAIIALIIVCVVAVMAAAGFGIGKIISNNSSDTTAETSESQSSDSDFKDYSDSENESDDGGSEEFPGTGNGATVDYSAALEKSRYKVYNDGDFSFVYLTDFFERAEKTGSGKNVTYTFEGDDGVSKLIYEKYEETGDPKEVIKSLSAQKANEIDMNRDVYYPYKTGNTYKGYFPKDPKAGEPIHGIVSGFQEGTDIQEYNYYWADGEKVISMTIIYPESELPNNTYEAGYTMDSYYRGFSVSNAKKHKVRTYEEFCEDEKDSGTWH